MRAKNYILFLIIILFTLKGNAQNSLLENPTNADSLYLLISNHTREDIEKVRLLNEYARECFYALEIEKGFDATKEAYELSEKLDFEEGKVMYYLTLAAYHGNSNPDMFTLYQKKAQWLSKSFGNQTRNYYTELEVPDVDKGNNHEKSLLVYTNILQKYNGDAQVNKEIRANIWFEINYRNFVLGRIEAATKGLNKVKDLYIDLGEMYPLILISRYKLMVLNRIGNTEESKNIELELIDLFLQSKDANTIGLIAQTMAATYVDNSRYLPAIEYYLKSIEEFEKTNDYEMLSPLHYDLGVAFENLGMNSKAVESYKKSIEAMVASKDSTNFSIAHGTLVFPLIALEKYEEAKLSMQHAISDSLVGNKTFKLARNWDAQGQMLMKQKKYRQAIPFFEKALNSFDQLGNNFWAKPFMLMYIAECHFHLNNDKEALAYALKCLEIANLEDTRTTRRVNLLLSNIYENLGNQEMAFKFLKNYQEIVEKSEKLDELNRVADAEVKSILEKSRSEIDELEREREQTKQKNKTQRLWILSITGALLSALLVALILYRNNKTKQKANKKLESTLNNLKATQKQLIQSEKMASLGELTAGIAHEIQNPLNFVNNFSEVNDELIEELKSEKAKGKSERDEELEEEILNDIQQNTEKINHHGKRAETIVKGMLQHSRTDSGEKELTDINELADEYLRLSYHGLRAKDKTFNADFKTEFDESLPKINVVPQDIGRVLLNLINNAFYEVDKKAKGNDPLAPKGGTEENQIKYKPEVVVSTSSLPPSGGKRGVKIVVKDNGPGIPSSIKDKIFQPFFTTKPTGSGTGLGLSLSYDIVKAHDGKITVESLSAGEAGKENDGTEFRIEIPLKS